MVDITVRVCGDWLKNTVKSTKSSSLVHPRVSNLGSLRDKIRCRIFFRDRVRVHSTRTETLRFFWRSDVGVFRVGCRG